MTALPHRPGRTGQGGPHSRTRGELCRRLGSQQTRRHGPQLRQLRARAQLAAQPSPQLLQQRVAASGAARWPSPEGWVSEATPQSLVRMAGKVKSTAGDLNLRAEGPVTTLCVAELPSGRRDAGVVGAAMSVARFAPQRVLGRSDSATVYEVLDTHTRCALALKMHPHASMTPLTRHQVLRGSRVHIACSAHEAALPLYAVFEVRSPRPSRGVYRAASRSLCRSDCLSLSLLSLAVSVRVPLACVPTAALRRSDCLSMSLFVSLWHAAPALGINTHAPRPCLQQCSSVLPAALRLSGQG